ncbi:MAG: DUF1592 domain-containing protein [Myxococcota bacterium]
MLEPFTAGMAIVAETMLQSPHFLYRIEHGALEGGVIALDDHQLASRLSYLLWDTMPDAELFRAADAGELRSTNALAAQARRMLDDPRAEEKLLDFHRQLLDLHIYDDIRLDGFPATIGVTMREEAERFLSEVLFVERGGLNEVLTASYSFVDADLAALYGLSGSYGDALERAELDPTQRAGIFTQPGFMASHDGDAAPIHRGILINLKMLCTELPAPPVFDPLELVGDTRREQLDSITGEGTCGATCHAQFINPVGFAFETFDDAGRWRTEDNGFPVDATAQMVFQDGSRHRWDGPVELAAAMAGSQRVHECYVGNWIEYAFGRPLQIGDEGLRQGLARESREGLGVKEIIVRLVTSELFTQRRQERS